MDVLESLSSGVGKPKLLLFLCGRGHTGQCIFLYLCSFLSSSVVILLSNKSGLAFAVQVYHVPLPISCISMPQGL